MSSFSDDACLVQYSIRATQNDTDAQILILRFGCCSRLISPSPAAGIPDIILQQTPSTLMREVRFPFPQEAHFLSQFWVVQFLSSFNIPSSAAQIIYNKISSFAQQLAPGDINANNFSIEADIHHITMLRIQPISSAPVDPPRTGASDSAIEKLIRNQKFDGLEEIGDCSVCYDDLNGGKEVTKMPCGHVYHKSCILLWLQRSNSCPLCRAPLEEQQ